MIRALLLLSVVFCSLAAADGRLDRWLADREKQREARATFNRLAAEDRAKKAVAAAALVRTLLADPQAKANDLTEVKALAAAIRAIDAAPVEALVAEVAAIPAPAAPPDAKVAAAWDKKVAATRAAMCKPLEKFTNDALKAQAWDVAHQTAYQILAIDPAYPSLRRGLGLTFKEGRWYGPKDMEMVKAGAVWDETLGWISFKDRDRYAAGEYYDLGVKKWTTLEAADAAHATWDNPWRINSEHVELVGTANLKDLVQIVNRVEAFYARIFASYAAFFASNSRDARIVFGLLDHPRLKMSMARNEADYKKSLPPGTSAGWSDGMFVSGTQTSYFYVGSWQVMYHEFTHQILDQFGRQGNPPAWLVEGAAVYTQSPQFVDGQLVLGDPYENMHLKGYLREAKYRLPLDKVLAITDGRAWASAADPLPNYCTAGMFFQFAMEADGRAYRADILDYLRDAYRGQDGGRLVHHYLGMSEDDLKARFASWEAGMLAAKPPAKAPAKP